MLPLLGMVPAQQQPPNSGARAMSGFKAGSPARPAVIYLVQNPSAQEGQDQEVLQQGREGEGKKEEGDEERGTRCWRSQTRTRPAELCSVI